MPFIPPGDLQCPETKHMFLKLPALTGSFFTTSATWKALSLFLSHDIKQVFNIYLLKKMNVRSFLASQPAWEKANRREAQGLCLGGNGMCVCVHTGSFAQSFLSLFHLMDCSLTGSSVHGILRSRISEWAAIFSSRESS